MEGNWVTPLANPPSFLMKSALASTIDYAIISDMYFHQVSSFTVKPESSLSDHCQIITRIETPLDIRTTNKSKQIKNNLTKLLPNFHWSSESNVNFKGAFNTPVCLNKLTDFMSRNFKLSSNDTEEANKQLTEILQTAAKMSSKLKSKPKPKHTKTNKWFNVECKNLRKKFHALSNQKNKNPSNSELREKRNEALKLYETFCNRKRKEFWTEKVNYL